MDGPGVDVREKGANQQISERRLFMQLQVWTGCPDGKPLVAAMEREPHSRACSTTTSTIPPVSRCSPSTRTPPSSRARSGACSAPSLRVAPHRPELTMLGRTYASGFEPDLEDWLLARPAPDRAECGLALGHLVPAAPRRRLRAADPAGAGRASCASTATIGRAYGDADLAHDVRLACHGLDTHDNDFVIGLVGRELHPLSHLVQAMRRTAQTSQYLQSLGPFFVGHALWQSPLR